MPAESLNPNDVADQWIEQLVKYEVGDPEWTEAAEALYELGAFVIPKLIDAWSDESMDVRRGVSKAMYQMGPRMVGDLTKAVGHKDLAVRAQAVQLLYGVAQKEEWQVVDILPALIKALDDPDSEVRIGAAKAVSAYRKNAEEAIPVLTRRLKDPEPYVRTWMIMALESIKPTAEEAIPALTEALLDHDCDVRLEAANAWATIGKYEVLILKTADLKQLTEGLKGTSEYERRRSAEALGSIGPAAKTAVPALTEALLDEDCEVRVWAARALCVIGEDHDVQASTIEPLGELVRNLRASDEKVRETSAMALGSVGSAAKAAVPALTEALLDKSYEVRFQVARALLEIGLPEVPMLERATLNELIVGLKDPNDYVRECSALSLGWIGPVAKESVPALTETLLDDSPDVRDAARDALDSIGGWTNP